MRVTITVEDNGETTELSVDLENYRAVPTSLRLLASILGHTLAKTYYVCVAAGINVLIGEYTRVELVARKAELRQILGY